MKIKEIAILVKLDDDKIYQVNIKREHNIILQNLLAQLSNSGKVEVFEKPVENIDII